MFSGDFRYTLPEEGDLTEPRAGAGARGTAARQGKVYEAKHWNLLSWNSAENKSGAPLSTVRRAQQVFNNGWVSEKTTEPGLHKACCHLKTVLTHTLAESAPRLKTVLKILQGKGFNSVCICWKESGQRGREKPHQTPWGAISVKSLALGEPGPDPWGLRNA